jgi:hypothetical protein
LTAKAKSCAISTAMEAPRNLIAVAWRALNPNRAKAAPFARR